MILITTKKGTRDKGIGVSYNSSYIIESLSVFPELQNTYGQGAFGQHPTEHYESMEEIKCELYRIDSCVYMKFLEDKKLADSFMSEMYDKIEDITYLSSDDEYRLSLLFETRKQAHEVCEEILKLMEDKNA